MQIPQVSRHASSLRSGAPRPETVPGELREKEREIRAGVKIKTCADRDKKVQ